MNDKEIKRYYYKSTNFSKYLIYTTLNKRGNWEPINTSNYDLDLCIISAYYRTCSDLKTCWKKFIKQNCNRSKISGDFKIGILDYIFSKSIVKLSDKKELFQSIIKKYGDREYLPLTHDISLGSLDKKLFKKQQEYYLKPNGGYERQGQLKTNKYNDVKKQLQKYKHKFKNWQLQEFITSYTDLDSFIRSVCIIVLYDGETSLYNSQINEYSSVKNKSTGMVNMSMAKWVYHDDGCYIALPPKKNEFIGKLGFANEVYDKLLGKGFYKKKITPQINKIIKESVLSIGELKNKKGKMTFHIFGVDLMINKKLNVKLLEFNPYPTHFVNARSECSPIKVLHKVYSGKKHYEKLIKYETCLLDEIFSITVDKVFPTKRKIKLEVLKQLL